MSQLIPNKEHLIDFLEYVTESYWYNDNRSCWLEIGDPETELDYNDVVKRYFIECNYN